MMNYTTRPAMESEFPAAIDLYQECWKDMRALRHQEWNAEKELSERLFRLTQFKKYGVHIIQANCQDVGLLVVTPRPKDIFIRDICVLPDYRSHGIGADIIANLKEQAAQDGIPLKLETKKNNFRAQKLYAAQGFSQVCETDKAITLSWQPEALHR